jgi:hypothetical protein
MLGIVEDKAGAAQALRVLEVETVAAMRAVEEFHVGL